jgi:hypothetical protein
MRPSQAQRSRTGAVDALLRPQALGFLGSSRECGPAEFTAHAAFKDIACYGSPRKARALQRAAAKILQRRVERNIGTQRQVITVQGAIGGVKMWEVLEDFVDPLESLKATAALADA